MPIRSRLTKNLENKSKHQLYLSIAGIIVVLFLLIKFGIPLLINFSLFLSGLRNSPTSNNQQNSQSIILAPTLNSTFSATNSASISVSGIAVAKESVQLFINDNITDVVATKDDGTFTFNNVSLNSGQNTIKVKAKKDNKESDFSDTLTISFINKQPALTVDTPQDGQSFSKDNNTIQVAGKTDPDDKVTVNDFWAIVDSNGQYSYNLRLQNGENLIKIVSTDTAGNKTEKDLKVTYSQ